MQGSVGSRANDREHNGGESCEYDAAEQDHGACETQVLPGQQKCGQTRDNDERVDTDRNDRDGISSRLREDPADYTVHDERDTQDDQDRRRGSRAWRESADEKDEENQTQQNPETSDSPNYPHNARGAFCTDWSDGSGLEGFVVRH
ncbi:hypothetical protein ACFTS5_12880 [Nocardia sp. NPDC056952]|uniref:hypothetical protein n=1 Tax=Nocardia sp. NPDC056952 TaxID=3345979 RepID=UPI003641C47A